MTLKRTARWTTAGLVAVERGQRFDDWTKRISAGGGNFNQGVKADYDAKVLNWTNNVGASTGTAEWYLDKSTLDLETDANIEDGHTVHMRINTATNVTNAIALGPATTIHAGSGAGNCYFAKAEASGVVHIYKMQGGTATSLASASSTLVPGDVLSLAYQWDIIAAEALLSVMVNGAVLNVVLDTTFRMSLVAGLPGVFGDDVPSTGNVMGFWSSEWWVTRGFETFSEIRRQLPEAVGGLSLQFMERQRFTDSTTPKVKHLVIGGLERVSWSFARIGGCKILDAEFKPDASAERYFEDPPFLDYVAGDWLGGDVLLNVKYDPSDDVVSDAVWRGRLRSSRRDPNTGMVKIRAEGLFESLKEVVLVKNYEQVKIKDIIVDVIQSAAKGAETDDRDGLILFNASKIVGIDSVLDLVIDLEVRWETADSVLATLTEYMPTTIVYGVDRDGEFYLDQQYETYEENGVHPGVQTFFVGADQIDSWDLETDLKDVRPTVLVLGKETEDGKSRINSSATCELSRAFFGNRTKVISNGEILDTGLASKVAAAESKKVSSPAINGNLKTIGLIQGQRSFWQSLVISAPSVAVNFKRAQSGDEYFLRRYGDLPAFSVKEKGSAGARITLPSTLTEQAMERGWVIHCALKFPFAHPGGSGFSAFLFGRPATSGATDHGWLSVYWSNTNGTDGTIIVVFTDTASSVRVISTAISVPVAGGSEVHLTIWRDNGGVFRVYDGNSLTVTDSTHTSRTQQTLTTPWRWFDHGNGDLTEIDGDFGFEEFWAVLSSFLGVGIEHDNSGGVVTFISRNHNQALHRNELFGLSTYGRFTETKAAAATTSTYPVMQRDALSVPTVGTATYVKSLAASTVDGDPISANSRNGYRMDSTSPKRWGGPAIFNAEQVKYELTPHDGILTRNFTLGRVPANQFSSIAAIERQIARAAELLNRTPTTV